MNKAPYITRFVLPVLALITACNVTRGDVKLPAIFGDHMIVQRGTKVPIWGSADPGEKVVVTAGGHQRSAVADDQGAWRVALDPIQSAEPMRITVAGKNTITIDDVLPGEVWICSGQSNMEFKLSQAATSQPALAAADRPAMRLFSVQRDHADAPLSDLKAGQWVVCTPETAKRFSAVGYFFGADLQQKLNVPVGLIDASWGGTRAEAWTPKETFAGLTLPYEPKWTESYLNPQRSPASTRPLEPRPFQAPSAIYNAMIHPLAGFAMRGVIWYQGESNAGHAEQYDDVLGALITGWRSRWGQGDFPFLIVQLANFDVTRGRPNPKIGGGWPDLREAQAKLVSDLPNVGLAVTIDVGEKATIHPRNKAEVGRRLALAAEKLAYGRNVVFRGPTFHSLQVDGKKAIVRFDTDNSSLVTKGNKLAGFEIAGQDGKFVPARAAIVGETVILRADEVPEPKSVRYGWDDDPVCTLYNEGGLPAAPFRTE